MNGDPTAKYVIGGWWLVLALVVIGFSTGILFIKSDEPEGRVVADDEWCEVGQKMEDGTLIYNGQRGTTELVAFATANGPVLMAKCK